jgi:hypothetical protein
MNDVGRTATQYLVVFYAEGAAILIQIGVRLPYDRRIKRLRIGKRTGG